MVSSDELGVVRSFYGSNLSAVGPSFPALGWYTPETQRVRFEVFELLGDLSHSSILDAGCGLGDFFRFMLEKKHEEFSYTGIDVMQAFIVEAQRRYCHAGRRGAASLRPYGDPQHNVQFKTTTWTDLSEPVDWVLCSGALNLKQPQPYAYAQAQLAIFLKLARKGVAVNFLSGRQRVAGEEDVFFYYDPLLLLEKAFALTPHVVLHHDYLANDFTVFLYPA